MSSRCTSRSAEAASSGTNDGGVVVVFCPLLRHCPSRGVACCPRCPCSTSSLSGKTNLCSKIRVTQVHHGRTCDGCTWGEPLGQWTWCARAVVRVRCRSRVLTCCSRLPCCSRRCACSTAPRLAPSPHGCIRMCGCVHFAGCWLHARRHQPVQLPWRGEWAGEQAARQAFATLPPRLVTVITVHRICLAL